MLSLSLLSIKDDYERIRLMDELNPDYLHLDVADGKFVSNYADFLNMPVTSSKKDVHLMVADVEEYIEKYSKLYPEYITFHIEATDNPEKMINLIKGHGIKVGIALSPESSVDLIKSYLAYVDLVLIMSVTTGYGGQAFLESSIPKIEELYSLREEYNYKYLIEIDGGISEETALLCKKSDLFAVGSYITLSDDYVKRAEMFKHK